MSAEESRQKIITVYKEKVHGQKPVTTGFTQSHDGKKGHWLEDAMGSKRDANNKPDLFGYEMKNHTDNKTTFGDWGPDYFIFRDEKQFPNLIGKKGNELKKQYGINKDQVFLRAFGEWRKEDNVKENDYGGWPNGGYYSWSGKPSPTRVTDGFNDFGQALIVNTNDSISIIYSYTKDKRKNKSELVPKEFQVENLELLKWSSEKIKNVVENKFNTCGWFKCGMKDGVYNEIVFGEPITIRKFLDLVKAGNVIFDTRMKERRPDGTDRMGMQWRASNKFWDSLVVERYP